MDDIPQHYKQFYVSYGKIKKNILKMSKKHKRKLEKDMIQNAVKQVDKQGIEMLPPFLFSDIIRQEIKKVNHFAEIKYNEIIGNLLNMYKLLKSLEKRKHDFDKSNIERELDMIGSDIIHFDFYIRKNSKTIVKLGFYFDKVMNISINQWLLLSLIKEKFCNINIDNLIVYLSYLYNALRSLSKKEIKLKKDDKWKPPDTFERTSTKFLIKYDDIVYTKVKIVKYLPYLIFDFSEQDLEKHFKYFLKHRKYAPFFDNVKKENSKKGITTNVDATAAEQISIDDTSVIKPFNESQQITSVYFDNKEADCYIKRILRYENAQLIRFRWYGDNDGNLDKTIFIERKIHHEEWTGEVSTKERFELPQKYVMKYMTGGLNIKEYFIRRMNKKKKEIKKQAMTMLGSGKEKTVETSNKKKKNNKQTQQMMTDTNALTTLKEKTIKNIKLGTQIQKKILNNKLKPIIRTSYLRAAFQLTDNNEVRISIDTNISMLNEYVSNRKNWCRLAEEALGKNEVIRLNYGIIEVKLKVDKMPEWISTILKTNKSINVYKYSKYQTAMAMLHLEKIKYIPIWIYNDIHEHFMSAKNITSSLIATKKEETPLQKKELVPVKTYAKWIQQMDTNKNNKKLEKENRKQKQKGKEYKRQKEKEKERQYALELEMYAANDLHASDDKTYMKSAFGEKKIKQFPKMINYVNAKIEDISNYNTLQKWNMLDKTYLWLNQKYNENTVHPTEKIDLLKIDPKVNFAAERTFLHYVLVSVYINLLALFLEKYKNERRHLDFVIATLFLASFTSLFYSYFLYLKRINIIQKRKTREPVLARTRFDSFLGPMILLFFLFVAIILSLYFNFKLKRKIPY